MWYSTNVKLNVHPHKASNLNLPSRCWQCYFQMKHQTPSVWRIMIWVEASLTSMVAGGRYIQRTTPNILRWTRIQSLTQKKGMSCLFSAIKPIEDYDMSTSYRWFACHDLLQEFKRETWCVTRYHIPCWYLYVNWNGTRWDHRKGEQCSNFIHSPVTISLNSMNFRATRHRRYWWRKGDNQARLL